MLVHQRTCPQCGEPRSYSSAAAMRRAEAARQRCHSCAKTQIPGVRAAIAAAYNEGLTNREIAAVVGCHHNTVADHLRALGKVTHMKRGAPPEPVDALHSRCRVCREVQRNDEFPFVRGQRDGRRLSMCRRCRAQQNREALGASPEAYFADRENRLRRGERGGGAKRSRVEWRLPEGYMIALWRWQNGICFYTGRQMNVALGRGYDPAAASLDRVDPDAHYEVGNVVLCMTRVNSIKNDLTLGEMHEWMPGWYLQVVQRLPVLTAEVVAKPDDRPRTSGGQRTPTWIIERRRRIEELKASGRFAPKAPLAEVVA